MGKKSIEANAKGTLNPWLRKHIFSCLSILIISSNVFNMADQRPCMRLNGNIKVQASKTERLHV